MSDQFHHGHDARGRLFGGFHHHTTACGQRRRDLPGGHEQWEVPRDDLPHYTDGLVQHDAHRVRIVLADGTFLRPDDACEVAEVVDHQRQIRVHRLADGLAVIDGLDGGQVFLVVLDHLRDAVEDVAALGGRAAAPGHEGLVRGGDGQFHILLLAPCRLGEDLPVDRTDIVEVFTAHRFHPLTTDVVVVAILEADVGAGEGDRLGTSCGCHVCVV